jgi:hypothetical protein
MVTNDLDAYPQPTDLTPVGSLSGLASGEGWRTWSLALGVGAWNYSADLGDDILSLRLSLAYLSPDNIYRKAGFQSMNWDNPATFKPPPAWTLNTRSSPSLPLSGYSALA